MNILAIALGGYVTIVVAFESLIGYFQPANDGTLIITTIDEAGNSNDRVLSRLQSDGLLYVAANQEVRLPCWVPLAHDGSYHGT